MKAHTTLWIDSTGKLTENAPERGIKIASFPGSEIPRHFEKKFHLEYKDGKVIQKMKPPPENKMFSGLAVNKRK